MQSAKCWNCVAIVLPSLIEGGGKIEDFDGGSFAITHITPSVCFADSSLKEGAEHVLIKDPDKFKFIEQTQNPLNPCIMALTLIKYIDYDF